MIVFTTKPSVTVNEQSGYEVVQVSATDTLMNKAQWLHDAGKRMLFVIVDPVHERVFRNLTRYKREMFPTESIVFLY